MKIKKRELRKGLPPLPINYPAPIVENAFDYNRLKNRVEDLCKKLGHVEVEVRDLALDAIPQYLDEVSGSYIEQHKEGAADAPAPEDLELLLQKLALGLFFCFWHSDKPLVQHECGFKIAKLVSCPRSAETQIMFVEALFTILAKKWVKIDHYRMDKFMALVRKVLYQSLLLVRRYSDPSVDADSDIANCFCIMDQYPAPEGTNKSLDRFFLNRFILFFQNNILNDPLCVGLALHLNDIFLDEFIRSNLGPDLFVHLSKQLPLYSMSIGNFLEKHVLDYFIMPLCAGKLDERRVFTLATSPEEERAAKESGRHVASNSEQHSEENDQICFQLMDICRWYSVQKLTSASVRPLFAEAETLLKQRLEIKLNPAGFRRLSKKQLHKKIAQEIAEAETVKAATLALKAASAKDKKKIKNKARSLLKSMSDDDSEGDSDIEKGGKTVLVKKSKKNRRLPSNPENPVNRELEKLKKKKAIRKERAARIERGESATKISIKGVRKNSKRSKLIKLTKKDILAMESEETPRWTRRS